MAQERRLMSHRKVKKQPRHVMPRSFYTIKRSMEAKPWSSSEIVDIININERLQKRKLNISPKLFSELWYHTKYRCQITGQMFGRAPDFDVGIQLWKGKWRLGLLPLVVTFNEERPTLIQPRHAPDSYVEEMRNELAAAVYKQLSVDMPSKVSVRSHPSFTIDVDLFGMRWDVPATQRTFAYGLSCRTHVAEQDAVVKIECANRRISIPFSDPEFMEKAVDATIDLYRRGLADRALGALDGWERYRSFLFADGKRGATKRSHK
jgi:hypothetical protein